MITETILQDNPILQSVIFHKPQFSRACTSCLLQHTIRFEASQYISVSYIFRLVYLADVIKNASFDTKEYVGRMFVRKLDIYLSSMVHIRPVNDETLTMMKYINDLDFGSDTKDNALSFLIN